MTLAVLDWGIGGFGTYLLLRERCPNLDILYLSDAGFPPYGTVSPERLGARLVAIAEAFQLDELIIACNAASSAVTPELALPTRTKEIIASGVELVASMPPCVVGVLGGEGTIRSRRHEAALLAKGFDVISRSAQPLSAHVEAGRLSGAALHADIQRIMEPLATVDAVLLACTHYPAIASQIQPYAPGARLLDPAQTLAQDAISDWQLERRHGSGLLSVFTSGDPERLCTSAALAFGVHLSPDEVSRFSASPL